jgi:hypothetical protein
VDVDLGRRARLRGWGEGEVKRRGRAGERHFKRIFSLLLSGSRVILVVRGCDLYGVWCCCMRD